MPELAAVFYEVGEPTYDEENFVAAARHCFKEMALDGEVAACGGGLQSEAAWEVIFADVLGRPVDEELWRSQRRGLDPDAGRTAFYDEGFARCREQLHSARALWK